MPHSGKSLCPSSESFFFFGISGPDHGIVPTLYGSCNKSLASQRGGGEVRTSKTRLLDAFGVIKFYIVAVSVAVFQSLSTSTHVFRTPHSQRGTTTTNSRTFGFSYTTNIHTKYNIEGEFFGELCCCVFLSSLFRFVPIFQAERASLPVLSSLPTDSFPKLSNFRTHWKLQSTSQSPSLPFFGVKAEVKLWYSQPPTGGTYYSITVRESAHWRSPSARRHPAFSEKKNKHPGQHGAAFSEAISFAEQRRRQQPTNDFIPSTTSQVQGFPPQQSGSPSPNEDR